MNRKNITHRISFYYNRRLTKFNLPFPSIIRKKDLQLQKYRKYIEFLRFLIPNNC